MTNSFTTRTFARIGALATRFMPAILLVAGLGATCATGFAGTVQYTLTGTTTQGTSFTGTLQFDTVASDFSSWDIIAAADPTAAHGFSAQQWTPSNTPFVNANSASKLTLINNSGRAGNYLHLLFPVLTGAAGQSVTFSGDIQELGGGCCNTLVSGTVSDATPEPATGAIFLIGITAIVWRFRAARHQSWDGGSK